MKILISAFKKVTEPNNPYHRIVSVALDRIRNGASKEQIKAYRETYDPKIKNKLPGYCFSGTFSTRNANNLIQHSGLITLDFDGYNSEKETEEYKEKMKLYPFVYSAFISPSGLGLKVLVKIPPEPENHKAYFKALQTKLKDKHFDISGSDVSRFCFESYDPDIYINEDCEVWTIKEEEEHENIGIDRKTVVVPLESENQIIQRLQTWFDRKYTFSKGQRNNVLFIFASALNDFGIVQSTAKSYLSSYCSDSFTEKRLFTTIESAYKRGSNNFGTKFFEDNQLQKKIEIEIRSGKSNSQIEKTLEKENLKLDDLGGIVDNIKSNIEIDEFWYYDERNKIRLSPHKFKFYLEQNNFLKFFPVDSQTFTFIKKEQNLIEETNEQRIKDYVLEDLLNRDGIGYGAYDFMANNPSYFNINYLSFLKSGDLVIKEDTKYEGFLYYKNCAVKVSKNKVKEIDYLDLDGFVWRNQIIGRDFKRADHHPSEFRRFIWLVSGQEIERYNSFKSLIGYLLHSHKTSANNRSVILNDETISDVPNGGSGKGLLWNALGKMKKVAMIDGKTFEFTKSFPYQTVSTDTQILVFDDVKRNFNYENLFSVITEGITIEYKGQDAIKIPVEKSPKILITTNYTIGGTGGSADRRKFEVEMSSHFGIHHTPIDEFGHMLFDDWDDVEWSRFDNFMINCLQYYLENGLVAHNFKNLDVRKFIKSTNMEFYEWTKDGEHLTTNTRLYKSYLYNEFLQDYPDYANGRFKLSQKRFQMYLKEYADFYRYEFNEGKDASGRWCKFISHGTETKPDVEPVNNLPF